MLSKRRTLSAMERSSVAAAAAVAIGVTDFGARAEVEGTEEAEAEGKETETGRGKRSLEPEVAGEEAEDERAQAAAAAAGTAEAAAKARRKPTILRCAYLPLLGAAVGLLDGDGDGNRGRAWITKPVKTGPVFLGFQKPCPPISTDDGFWSNKILKN
jgi:hypothetical protein